jgi:pimeloyl-ACP methyl ester carboxylesterase
MKKRALAFRTAEIMHRDRRYLLEYFIREGSRGTIFFVHGLGGAKENFLESTKSHALDGYRLICFDNPGTGNSTYYPDKPLQVDDLAEITHHFVEQLDLRDFILVGASMGGLTTLLYLRGPGRRYVRAYANIEGNLMPEDCMFSSKVVSHTHNHFVDTVYPETIVHMKRYGNTGYHIIANNLELNTDASSYYHYSFQTVRYSSTGELLDQYIKLDIPRIFIYGEKNQGLSYLPQLANHKLTCVMIPDSDHFLFYDNPAALYRVLAHFASSVG